jgi:hypothetical protein
MCKVFFIVDNDTDDIHYTMLAEDIDINYHIQTQYPNKNISYVSIEQLPSQGLHFFNAWEIVDSAIQINMPKARDIHRATLRQERAPRLTALDVSFMRALERGDTATTQEIAAQKQALRDIPSHPAIEAAQTPEELMALTLDILLTPHEETATP